MRDIDSSKARSQHGAPWFLKFGRGGRLVKFQGILASIAPALTGVALVAGLALAQPALAATCATLGGTVTGGECVVNDASGNSITAHYTPGSTSNLTVNATNPAGVTTTSPGAEGIRATNNNGGLAVNVDGDVKSDQGSLVLSTIDGDLNLHAKGALTSINAGDAVSLNASGGGFAVGATHGGNVNVQVDGKITAADDGVDAELGAVKNVTITTAGIEAGGPNADSDNGRGIFLTRSGTGDTTITTNGSVHAGGTGIYVGGALDGALTINSQGIVSDSDDGIQLAGNVGSAGATQPTSITTGDIHVAGTGVNLARDINRVDGATTVTTGNITAGGEGVAIESSDNADQYLIKVQTGSVTTGGTGIAVNQSGTGGITVKTGDIHAGTTTASSVNSAQRTGGYGVRLDSDPHGPTAAGQSDFNLTTGNVIVSDASKVTATNPNGYTGTGIAIGTLNAGGNGNTTVKTGSISAGTGVVYARTGTGAVDITTGDITATTGDGANFGNDITHNDVAITTGDINAKGYGIYGNTQVDAGKLGVTTGNVTAGNTAISLIHSGQGPLTITTGDNITSTGGAGFSITQDPSAGGAGGFVLNTKNVTAQGRGINLVQNDNVTGDVSITNTGAITSNGDRGVYVDQSAAGGNLDVTTNAVTAAGNALELYGDSTGNTSVTTNGAVKSTGGYGVYVAKRNTGDVNIHAKDTVNATSDAIALAAFTDGNINITADKDITSTGAIGIDLGAAANGGTNTGSISITSGGDIKAAGTGINGDTGGSTTSTTISVADMDTTGGGLNWINSGTKPFTFTSTGTINAGGIGINLTTDSITQNPAPASTDSETIINVNNITTPNNTAINLNSNAAKGSTINVNGAITTPAASIVHAGDGMDLAESSGPLNVNIATGASITSYQNTMELTNNGTKGTTVNVDGTLQSTHNAGGSDGVIWVWNTPGTTTVNINDGSTVQAADPTGFAMTDNNGNSVTIVGKATVTGGFRLGNGSDTLTFNGTDMANVGTLDGGDDASVADGMVDTLNLNGISHFTRNLATAGQEVENWEAVNLNGGTADLVGTLTTGQFTNGKDASGAPAALTIGAGHVGDTLTISGNYVGAGGGLTLDTDASNHTSDKLVVGGNTSGITALGLNDLTGGGTSDRQDIEVVDVTGTSPGSAFVLANGPAMLGGTNYTLGQQGNNWFLLPQLCPPAAGQALGCVTDDTLTFGGTTTVSGNVQGGGGSDIITVKDGASVTGIVAGGDPGADASQSQDTGDTITINTTGSVGGVQGNLGDDMISVIGGSTVNGDVQGNQGADQISIGSNATGATGTPTVTGNVDGGDGTGTDTTAGQNQIWVLGNAQVGGNVQAGGGGDKIVLNGTGAAVAGAINGGVGNDVIDLMAGTAGSVAAGDGDDNVQLDGATVTNAIDAGAGNNIVTLNGGTAGSVAAGSGMDKITLAGATVNGAINAGDGTNTVDLNSGSAGNVITGADADTITLAGATVGAIQAGDGDNIVALNGGSAASVAAGNGNNQITLAGATIAGAITAGNGVNTIDLNGGSAASVTAGNGGNTVNLAGAAVAGAINTGAGADTINLTNGTVGGGVSAGAGADTVNVAGSTFTLGTTKLDGGAAGEGNTLNLNNVNQTLTTPQSNLVNWDAVNATDSTLTVNGGDSITTAQLRLMNSTLVAHNGFTVNGNLSLDPSTIDMQDGTAGGRFTVTGNYAAVGSGNTLKIDADFASNTADQLNVGGTVSGKTTVNVNDVTPAGTPASGKDVVVATSGTAGGISAGNFDLAGGAIPKGIWSYGLADSSTDSAAAPDTVVLHPSLNSVASTYESAPALIGGVFNHLPTMEQRVGQRQWLVAGGADDPFQGVWLRMHGERVTQDPRKADAPAWSRTNDWGAQMGVDVQLYRDSENKVLAGVTGHYQEMNANIHPATASGQGAVDADGGGAGVNVTLLQKSGLYADAQGKYTRVRADLGASGTGRLADNNGQNAWAGSLEVGRRMVVGDGNKNVIVPQGQLTYGEVDTDRFTDKAGNTVDMGDNNSIIGRIGVAYQFHPNGYKWDESGANQKMAYVIGNIVEDFSGATKVQVNGQTLRQKGQNTWAELGAGGTFEIGKRVGLYGEVSYRAALSGTTGDHNHGVAGTVGVRVGF